MPDKEDYKLDKHSMLLCPSCGGNDFRVHVQHGIFGVWCTGHFCAGDNIVELKEADQ